MNDIWNFIGFAASILSAITFIPEVLKALKTKHLNDLSWGMLLLVAISSLLWFAFAMNFYIFPLMFSSTLNIIMSLILIYIKSKYQYINNSLERALPEDQSS